MTRKIRKYKKYKNFQRYEYYDEPIFNSNYLFAPMFNSSINRKNLSLIRLYDISSMKIKGTPELTDSD